MPVTLSDFIDLSDHDNFVDAVPHEAFAQLRREDPVHWNPEPDGGAGFWAVTRYEDIRTVHRTPRSSPRRSAGTSLEDLEPEHIEARKSMIDMDPPRHDELRALVNRRFTPSAVGVWEEQVRNVLPARCSTRRCPRASSTSCTRSPPRSRCRCSPRSSGCRRTSGARSSRSVTGCSATPTRSTRTIADDDAHRHLPFSSPAALDMFAFGRRIADERRQDPRDDIMSELAFEPALPSARSTCTSCCWRPPATRPPATRSATGCWRCCEHPDELERSALRAGCRRCGKTAAEEMLRWATPVHHFRRTAAVDTELAGVEIGAGDKVTTWFVSGNRDETVFEEPMRFDVRPLRRTRT